MQYQASDPYAARGTVDTGPGPALGQIGNVFQTPNPQQQLALAQAKRSAAADQGLGQIFASGLDPNSPGVSAYLANGGDPAKLATVARMYSTLHGGVDATQNAELATATNNYGSTPLSQQRAEAAELAKQQAASNIAAQAQVRTAGLDPVQVRNADGSVGWTTKAAIAQGSQPQGATPLLSPDAVKGALDQNLLPKAGAAPGAPAPTADAMSDDQRQLAGLAAPPSKLEIKQTGTDQLGNPSFSTFDPTTGEVKPVTQPGAQAAEGPAPSAADPTGGLHGAQFLATLPLGIQDTVKSIAEGRALPPPATTRGGKVNPIFSAVQRYDPEFDASNTQARFQTAKDFSPGGKNGMIVGSAGSALGHLGAVIASIPTLGNANFLGGNIINAGKNTAEGILGGPSAAPLNGYNAALQKFAGELEKFYTAGGGTEAERRDNEAALSPNKSPSELYAAASRIGQMLQTKVDQMGSQRDQIMGPLAPPYPRFGADARATLAALDKLNQGYAKTGNWTGVANAPGVTVREQPANAATYKIGAVVEGKGGKRYTYTGGDSHDQKNWMVIPGVQ